MPAPAPRLLRAWFESTTRVVVELDQDWKAEGVPEFLLDSDTQNVTTAVRASALATLRAFAYQVTGGEITFALPLERGCAVDPRRESVYLAGDFNGWEAAMGHEQWKLHPAQVEGVSVLQWRGAAARFFHTPRQLFKFVTSERNWLVPPDDAPNSVRTPEGHLNRVLDPSRTGQHLWEFAPAQAIDLAKPGTIRLANARETSVPLIPGNFFYDLRTDLPLGAIVRENETVFRLFAPRAKSVSVVLSSPDEPTVAPSSFPLTRHPDADGHVGVWEVALGRSLHGWYYWFQLDGIREGSGRFDPARRVIDPYAMATVHREGPGIILDPKWMGEGDREFVTPAWHDLVIVEAHVRDLTALAPLELTPQERGGFTGLRKWVESPDFYLHRLGVNCVELQPIQEFDNKTHEEYHWGYMTNNYFSPESSYALDPAHASGVHEFQELVRAFHRRGLAVILDVVYNHEGEPAHLLFIDRLYYFEQDAEGKLANWSGCGNDIRARSAMARRLIIDSCLHLVQTYGVDGFRFDLAELLGVEVLRDVEVALKRVKPNVILIAEPWSFRGHVSGALRDTGWASWNDGYRDFVRNYILGVGSPRRLEYFLRGSPWYFAKWPAQTVNYVESHDDRAWIDMITENPEHDGYVPTGKDRRRTRLMVAILMMSHGIPMLSAGQDFLRSKRGVNNTYLRGDLNALEYDRAHKYLSTHKYFKDWIALRRSHLGSLLRQHTRPSESFFQFAVTPGEQAIAALYNADRSQGSNRLLFVVNPSEEDVSIPLGSELVASGNWQLRADQDRFYTEENDWGCWPVTAELMVPAFGCALWCDAG